jgi:hypothetical protein
MKVRVNLRWLRGGSDTFPFQYELDENTTVREVCGMVLETNNRWHGNPRFSVVKVISACGARKADEADEADEADNAEHAKARAVLVDEDLRVGDLRGEYGECYFVFVAG